MVALVKQHQRPFILEGRKNLRPYIYSEFHQAFLASILSPWSFTEVAMGADVDDWHKASDRERKVIGGLLKGFSLVEYLGAGCFWSDVVAQAFPHPEIIIMAKAYSHEESIHALGYDHLESTLNLDTYEAFMQDPVLSAKLDFAEKALENEKNIAKSLAVFSGAIEGVSLFSSFAILLSFSKKNQYKGMAQILSWSALQECVHSNMGILLYKKLLQEAPYLEPDPKEIAKSFQTVVENEISFIQPAFEDGDLDTITKQQAIDYVKYRANKKLMELNIPPCYLLSGDYREVKHFFDTILTGRTVNDFFAQSRNGSNYSAKLNHNFSDPLLYVKPTFQNP